MRRFKVVIGYKRWVFVPIHWNFETKCTLRRYAQWCTNRYKNYTRMLIIEKWIYFVPENIMFYSVRADKTDYFNICFPFYLHLYICSIICRFLSVYFLLWWILLRNRKAFQYTKIIGSCQKFTWFLDPFLRSSIKHLFFMQVLARTIKKITRCWSAASNRMNIGFVNVN